MYSKTNNGDLILDHIRMVSKILPQLELDGFLILELLPHWEQLNGTSLNWTLSCLSESLLHCEQLYGSSLNWTLPFFSIFLSHWGQLNGLSLNWTLS